jgi:hypothetical protein
MMNRAEAANTCRERLHASGRNALTFDLRRACARHRSLTFFYVDVLTIR